MRTAVFLKAVLALSLMGIPVCYGRNFYVDSNRGDDSSDGRTASTAWKTLERVNSAELRPGDKVCLCRTSAFTGQLEIRSSGSKFRHLVVRPYGRGSSRPVINGNGGKDYTLLVENASYVEVRGIEVTNRGSEPAPGRRGIMIRARDCGDLKDIRISDMSVHDVNGSLKKSLGGGSGIMVACSSDSIPSRFIGLRIERCHIYDCMRNGINFSGNSGRTRWNPSLHVVIRGNLLENIPGDGIVPIGCDGALVEKNVLRDSPDIMDKFEAAAGIWPWGSDNTVIRYNEVSGHKAKWDGQGFDADYNCINTTFRYNYSHDNYGGFFLICNDGGSLGKSWNAGTKNVLIEKNVSINDGIRPYETRSGWLSPSFHITGPAEGVDIRDNLIIMPAAPTDSAFVTFNNWGDSWPVNVYLHSNTIVAPAELKVNYGQVDEGSLFGNKVISGISEEGKYSEYTKNTPLRRILNRVRYVKAIR